ncbi:hypothetical protein ACNOYE_30930 [Nannocystaceae bacterium ST9]
MGRLKIALTINWEGRTLAGVETLARLRQRFSHVPVVHFMSAAYFARGGDYRTILETMRPAFSAHDEIGLLLNTWQSIHGATVAPGLEPRGIIEDSDPILEVDYLGIEAQQDSGYTRALSGFPDHDIDAWIRNSKLLISPLLKHLVKQPGIAFEAMLRGVRAGHGMASDAVLEHVRRAGFGYDASAYDSTWALRYQASSPQSPFAAWSGMLAGLWGPDEPSARELSNAACRHATASTGVDWRTQPFAILSGDAGVLLEMPLNGGMIPPVSPTHLLRIAGALAKLQSGAGSYLSFGIHQDTADAELLVIFERVIETLEREYEVQWCTLSGIADGLVDDRPVAPPVKPTWVNPMRSQMRH